MESIGQPISRHEALRVSRAILERAEQERNHPDLLLARYVLCRYALEERTWAIALEHYLQELEIRRWSTHTETLNAWGWLRCN